MAYSEKLQVVPATTVVLDRRKSVKPGGWLTSVPRRTASARERLGYSHSALTAEQDSQNNHYSFYRQHRALMPEQYWTLYKNTPDVRACIDSIVRRVATWDWHIRPTVNPHDVELYEKVTKECKAAETFLALPGSDGATWQELMTAMATDLLIYDAGVLEIVENAAGEIAEITTWLGSECFPITDAHGRLIRYDQESENNQIESVSFEPNQICYFQLFKNNRSTLGLPLIESIINECVAVILADEHAMLALDADEIPPGLLVLGGVAGPAAERARADLQSMRGKDHRIRVITSPQPQGIEAKWVELRRSMKELEMGSVVDKMRHIIWRVFGVTPVELGETEGIPRASAEVQMDVASSHLITPILELIQARFNAQIVPQLVSDSSQVEFVFDRNLPATAQERLDIAKRAEVLLRNGVITINEARADIGLLPVDGGDAPFLITAMGPMPLTDVALGLGTEQDSVDLEQNTGGRSASTRQQRQHVQHDSNCCSPTSDGQRGPVNKEWKNILREQSKNEWLPSGWQNDSKFAGVRTVPLETLAETVVEYAMTATGLYIETAEEVAAIIRAAYYNGTMSVVGREYAKRQVDEALSALIAKWQLRCSQYYVDAAQIGVTAAEQWMGNLPEYDYERAAENYIIDAMAWLGDSGGLVGTLRAKLATIIDRATMRRDRIDDIDDGSEMYAVVATADATFAAQAHRINHWSGKMVPLASVAALESLASAGTIIDPDTGVSRVAIWMYEWVANADKRICKTCAYEGGAGYRRLDQASVLPGQGTICGALCRCVLTFWTENEVNAGTAVSLTEMPPNPPGTVPPPKPTY